MIYCLIVFFDGNEVKLLFQGDDYFRMFSYGVITCHISLEGKEFFENH